jgi:hypothetical protein
MWFQHAQECFLHKKLQFPPTQYDLTRRVWFWHFLVWLWHAQVWFIHAKCSLYTQSLIWTQTIVICGVGFPHVECDFTRRVCFLHTREFDTYAWEYITHECDFCTLECDSHTQCDFVWFRQARMWFRHAGMWFHTQNVVSTCTRVMLTRMRICHSRVW